MSDVAESMSVEKALALYTEAVRELAEADMVYAAASAAQEAAKRDAFKAWSGRDQAAWKVKQAEEGLRSAIVHVPGAGEAAK